MRDIVFAIAFTAIILGGIHLFFLAEMEEHERTAEMERTAELEREVAELREQLEEQQQMEWMELEAKWNDRIKNAELPEEYRVDHPAPHFYVPEVPDFDYGIVEIPERDYLIDMEQQETQQILRGIERSLQGW